MASRWATADAEQDAQLKRDKEAKKAAKAQKQAARAKEAAAAAAAATAGAPTEPAPKHSNDFALGWTPAKHIDAYERLNHIEEGTYGTVFRARDLATNKVVAIKKMKPDTRQAGFPVTTLREVQALHAAVGHDNIVHLQQVVTGPLGEVFLVMEFVEHDLRTLMDDMQDPWLAGEVKTLVLQLSRGLDFLHDRWILHRDLKTSNILMNNRGQVKIADFGMARFTSDPPPANLTALVVTLWYRSPELLLGAQSYDHSVDVWSLGCVMGELLTKEPMLQGRTEVDQLAKRKIMARVPEIAKRKVAETLWSDESDRPRPDVSPLDARRSGLVVGPAVSRPVETTDRQRRTLARVL